MWTKRRVLVGLVLIASLSLVGCDKEKTTTDTKTESTSESVEDGGFYEDEYGDKYAIGYEGVTPEDIVYTYTKSLALLDFDTVENYMGANSAVVEGFTDLNSSEVTDVSILFRRKMYKEVLNSLIVTQINDTVNMGDTRTVNFTVEFIDLESLDLYTAEKEDVIAKMNDYYTNVDNSIASDKVSAYVYDWVGNSFAKALKSGEYPKTTKDVELTFTKNEYGNWLITDDYAINSLCLYYDGNFITSKIFNDYEIYVEEQADTEESSTESETTTTEEANTEVAQ